MTSKFNIKTLKIQIFNQILTDCTFNYLLNHTHTHTQNHKQLNIKLITLSIDFHFILQKQNEMTSKFHSIALEIKFFLLIISLKKKKKRYRN